MICVPLVCYRIIHWGRNHRWDAYFMVPIRNLAVVQWWRINLNQIDTFIILMPIKPNINPFIWLHSVILDDNRQIILSEFGTATTTNRKTCSLNWFTNVLRFPKLKINIKDTYNHCISICSVALAWRSILLKKKNDIEILVKMKRPNNTKNNAFAIYQATGLHTNAS